MFVKRQLRGTSPKCSSCAYHSYLVDVLEAWVALAGGNLICMQRKDVSYPFFCPVHSH
jgi:hypothetical protein